MEKDAHGVANMTAHTFLPWLRALNATRPSGLARSTSGPFLISYSMASTPKAAHATATPPVPAKRSSTSRGPW
eukprot:11158763-Lingulodinium_polyedra.AAC.1